MPKNTKVALIVGAGDAIGSAIMRKFSQQGLTVCGARRHGEKLDALVAELTADGRPAFNFSCDARREDAIEKLFATIESSIGAIDVVVFNVGANVPMGLLQTDSKKFFKIWKMSCYAGFLSGREAARYMLKRQRGTIIFTGAFASAKHGLRALAQSMARELGPQNIHIAHVVIDGGVDTEWVRDNVSDFEHRKSQNGIINPDVAEKYIWFYQQPPNAWTFELDLRPWQEKW